MKKKDAIVKLIIIMLIVVLCFVSCNKAQAKQEKTATEQQTAEAQPSEQQSTEAQPSEQQTAEAQPSEQQSTESQPVAEQSEEDKLTAYAESLKEMNSKELVDELLRVNSEEKDYTYQQAVISRLMQENTSQKSPCMLGEYPIVRVFNGFILLGDDGEILVFEDDRHLHLSESESCNVIKENGTESYEEKTIIWKDGVIPQWALVEIGGTRYLFYRITWDDVNAGDEVYDAYNKHVRQATKAVVEEIKKNGVVSEKNYNILESIAFQTARKSVSSDDYCIVQYLTREVCGRYDLSGRTLINLKVDENGELKKVDTSSPSLIILEEDLSIKVTIVTEETEEGVQFEETAEQSEQQADTSDKKEETGE